MIHLSEIDRFAADYAQLEHEPLTVTVRLRECSPIIGYDPIHLDGLLARMVVMHATKGALLPNSEEPYWLPLPLMMVWQSPEGYPLWAASLFSPVGDVANDIQYSHKRSMPGEFIKGKALISVVGRWMDRRVPLPARVSGEWRAQCIGNRRVVEALLSGIDHIGKRRGSGFGAVMEWRVEPATFDNVFIADDKLAHPIPVAAAPQLGLFPDAGPMMLGWTPPAWKPNLLAPCYPAGAPVRRMMRADDFYAAAL